MPTLHDPQFFHFFYKCGAFESEYFGSFGPIAFYMLEHIQYVFTFRLLQCHELRGGFECDLVVSHRGGRGVDLILLVIGGKAPC